MSVESEQVEILYCICRSAFANKFMIGCDGCDEWFHGSCIDISSDMARDIESYFCPLCVEKDPELKTVYKSKKKKEKVKEREEEEGMRKPKLEITKKKHDFPRIPKIDKEKVRQEKEERREKEERKAERREEAQRKLEQDKKIEKEARRKEKERGERKLKEKKAREEVREKKVVKPRIIEESDEEDDDADFNSFLSSIAPKVQKESSEEDVDVEEYVERVEEKKKKKKVTKKKTSEKHSVQVAKVSEESSEEEEEKQCIGPNCCHAARPGSRYCSEECGVQLAMKRIRTFLPERKPSLTEKCKAEVIDIQLIKKLELQQQTAHQKIAELNLERKNIMKLIERARGTECSESLEQEEDEEEIEGEMTDCVTCGMPYPTRTAVRHMERCYNKFEAQVSLGSAFKCSVQWESMFCDEYDRQQGAYCKKLKVLCPDHNKEKEEHDGVCGCPLQVTDLNPESETCQRPKKACNRHISWEKIRLGECDMERVYYFLKLEESFEEMRKVRCRLANRNNLLQVLLNGTIVHT